MLGSVLVQHALQPHRESIPAPTRRRGAHTTTAPGDGGVLSLSGLVHAAGVLALCIVLTIPGRPAYAADRHYGVLAPYADGPPPVVLSAADLGRLADGDTLLRDFRVGEDPRRLAIVRVRAPAETVWSVLRDFERYPEWVKGLTATRVYRRNRDDIYVSFDYRHWLVGDVRYHIRHTYPGTATGWGTWVLDPEHPSDLIDTVGFWRVVPVAGEAHTSDVVYSTRIVPGDWLARLVGEWFVDDTLRTVVKGLKSRAENRASGYSK